LQESEPLKKSLNIYGGKIVNKEVAELQNKEWHEVLKG